MVTMGVFPFQGKTHMVEPGIEIGTSWLVVRSPDHQATRLVLLATICITNFNIQKLYIMLTEDIYVFGMDLRINNKNNPICH